MGTPRFKNNALACSFHRISALSLLMKGKKKHARFSTCALESACLNLEQGMRSVMRVEMTDFNQNNSKLVLFTQS